MQKVTSLHSHRIKKRYWILLSILIVLIAFRLYLPVIVLHFVNKDLNKIPGYEGHAEGVTLSLWKGAYQIKGITLNKMSGKVPVPFFSCDALDLALEWRALIHGKVVGQIEFEHPTVNFVNGPTKESSQTGIDKSWISVIKALSPLGINRIEIEDGEVHYRDFYSTPKVDIFLSDLQVVVANLKKKAEPNNVLPGSIDASAKCFNTGNLSLNVKLDALNSKPTFEFKEKLNGVQLTSIDNLTEAYLKVKITKGTFEIYTDLAAKNGSFVGYIKPMFHNIEVDRKLKDKSVLKWLEANGIQLATDIFSNHKHHKQIATSVPIYGKFEKPETDKWVAVVNLLRNAFIQAITPTLDSTLHLSDVDKAGEEGFIKNPGKLAP